MNPLRFLILLAVVASTVAVAQDKTEMEGLDLSEDTSKTPPPPPPPVAEPPPDVPAAEGETKYEKDTTQDDRVKSVQRKLYLKRGRVELAPYIGVSVNDPFYSKWGGAVRLAFYPSDNFALAARFALVQTLPTDDVRTAKSAFNARIFYSVPNWWAMFDLEWSPFYGKAAMMNSILHIDGYLVGGAGAVYTNTTPERGLAPGADLGCGLRFVVKDFVAVNVALINTMYVDQPAGTTKGAIQNVMMLNAGISLFMPFKSTYREAE